MSKIKVEKLKSVLQSALNDLEKYDEKDTVELESNTYFLNGANYFLGISGYDGGYLDLRNIDDKIEFAEDEEEFDDE